MFIEAGNILHPLNFPIAQEHTFSLLTGVSNSSDEEFLDEHTGIPGCQLIGNISLDRLENVIYTGSENIFFRHKTRV